MRLADTLAYNHSERASAPANTMTFRSLATLLVLAVAAAAAHADDAALSKSEPNAPLSLRSDALPAVDRVVVRKS